MIAVQSTRKEPLSQRQVIEEFEAADPSSPSANELQEAPPIEPQAGDSEHATNDSNNSGPSKPPQIDLSEQEANEASASYHHVTDSDVGEYENESAHAQSQKDSKYQTESKCTENVQLFAPFPVHFSLSLASRLQIGDTIDYRCARGVYRSATIADKQGANIRIHFDGSSPVEDVWSHYVKKVHCFYAAGSVTKRPPHRLLNIAARDKVDLNPKLRHPGWTVGKIKHVDPELGQVAVAYKHNGKHYIFVSHLDDEDEIAEFASKTESERNEPQRKSKSHSRRKTVDDNQKLEEIQSKLLGMGFEQDYIRRALRVYHRNYGAEYDTDVLTELIFRLQTKDSDRGKHTHHSSIVTNEQVLGWPVVEDEVPSSDRFPHHMSVLEAYRLRIHDQIDHRDRAGLFRSATISDKVGTNLKIDYDAVDKYRDEWSNFTNELWRFAKHGSIAQRPAHRLLHLAIGDIVYLNPKHRHLGWKCAELRRFDDKSGQVQVSYESGDCVHWYWVHLDDESEIRANSTPIQQATTIIHRDPMALNTDRQWFATPKISPSSLKTHSNQLSVEDASKLQVAITPNQYYDRERDRERGREQEQTSCVYLNDDESEVKTFVSRRQSSRSVLPTALPETRRTSHGERIPPLPISDEMKKKTEKDDSRYAHMWIGGFNRSYMRYLSETRVPSDKPNRFNLMYGRMNLLSQFYLWFLWVLVVVYNGSLNLPEFCYHNADLCDTNPLCRYQEDVRQFYVVVGDKNCHSDYGKQCCADVEIWSLIEQLFPVFITFYAYTALQLMRALWLDCVAGADLVCGIVSDPDMVRKGYAVSNGTETIELRLYMDYICDRPASFFMRPCDAEMTQAIVYNVALPTFGNSMSSVLFEYIPCIVLTASIIYFECKLRDEILKYDSDIDNIKTPFSTASDILLYGCYGGLMVFVLGFSLVLYRWRQCNAMRKK